MPRDTDPKYQVGPHDELLETRGRYSELFRLQASRYK
jgi:hypothetical protein